MATKKSPTHIDGPLGRWWITSNRRELSLTTSEQSKAIRQIAEKSRIIRGPVLN
jgi:hypothetical protein